LVKKIPITGGGWAQINYKYGDISSKLEYDLYYIKRQCLPSLG
jgi:lipopolysaccharide/colanic/teichoic acid biosynthesis glycosyltransferase